MASFVKLARRVDGSGMLLESEVSVDDYVLINSTREAVTSGRWEASMDGIPALCNISLAWPTSASDRYSYVMENAMTRKWIGHIQGRRCELRPECAGPGLAVLEYACAFLHGNPDLTIEWINDANDEGNFMFYLNGREMARLKVPSGGLYREPGEIRMDDDELFGRFGLFGPWYDKRFLIKRDGVPSLPMTPGMGASSSEVLAIIFRMITLKPLWSRYVPENKCRVIDCWEASDLTDLELITYFVFALFFHSSIYNTGDFA